MDGHQCILRGVLSSLFVVGHALAPVCCPAVSIEVTLKPELFGEDHSAVNPISVAYKMPMKADIRLSLNVIS